MARLSGISTGGRCDTGSPGRGPGCSARRREWAVAGLLAGTLAFIAVHAAFLLPSSRYGMPCWLIWWVGVAYVVRWAGERYKGLQPVRTESPKPISAARDCETPSIVT